MGQGVEEGPRTMDEKLHTVPRAHVSGCPCVAQFAKHWEIDKSAELGLVGLESQ